MREAVRRASDGDVIEIDAATYRGDGATFTQRDLTIRGVNGRPRFDADGTSEEGKGILVARGGRLVVENLELANCRVADENGAGIRHEAGALVVANVIFRNNENGILSGNNAASSVEIRNSQFIENGHGDGYSHNLYVGRVGRLIVRSSYFTRARVGHLLKSRARVSVIEYNRLTDEPSGTASYEIDLPDGGIGIVTGNLIEQSATTENSTIIAFGAEGLGQWPTNRLYLSHNTVVNHRPAGCTFVSTREGSAAHLSNNLFVGPNCRMAFGGPADERNNPRTDDTSFVAPSAYDYQLKSGTALTGTAIELGPIDGFNLVPSRMYVHPADSTPITSASPRSPGAFPVTK